MKPDPIPRNIPNIKRRYKKELPNVQVGVGEIHPDPEDPIPECYLITYRQDRYEDRFEKDESDWVEDLIIRIFTLNQYKKNQRYRKIRHHRNYIWDENSCDPDVKINERIESEYDEEIGEVWEAPGYSPNRAIPSKEQPPVKVSIGATAKIGSSNIGGNPDAITKAKERMGLDEGEPKPGTQSSDKPSIPSESEGLGSKTNQVEQSDQSGEMYMIDRQGYVSSQSSMTKYQPVSPSDHDLTFLKQGKVWNEDPVAWKMVQEGSTVTGAEILDQTSGPAFRFADEMIAEGSEIKPTDVFVVREAFERSYDNKTYQINTGDVIITVKRGVYRYLLEKVNQ